MSDWQERLITAVSAATTVADPGGALNWQDRLLTLLNAASTETDPGGAWQDRIEALLGGEVSEPTLDWQERIIVAAGGTAYSDGNWQDRMVAAFEAWAS